MDEGYSIPQPPTAWRQANRSRKPYRQLDVPAMKNRFTYQKEKAAIFSFTAHRRARVLHLGAMLSALDLVFGFAEREGKLGLSKRFF